MKEMRFAGMLLALLVVAWGCGGGDYSSPTDTAKSMMAAAKSGDEDAVVACYCNETRDTFRKLKEFAEKQGIATDDNEMAKKFSEGTVTYGEEKIDGNKATLAVNMDGMPQTLNFVKEGGDWKVSMPEMKEGLKMMENMGDFGEMMKKQMEDMPEDMPEEIKKQMEEARKKMQEMNK